jgi:hypothetical protein
MESVTGTLPLSVLFDRMAGPSGARDQDFVRAFTDWLQANAAHLELGLVAHYTLEDVVATFHMRDEVKLVVTGYPPAPYVGSVTLEVAEPEFPRVLVTVRREIREDPYEFCTLDYFDAGRQIVVTGGPYIGQTGRIQVCATVSGERQVRVRLDTGPSVTVDPASIQSS